MATNLKKDDARYLSEVAATAPATASSGDPVVVGQIPGVALTDEGEGGNASGNITVDTAGIYTLSVVGAADAIAAGDIVYYDGDELNDDSSNGTRFGYALGAVGSGATASIDVKIGY